jgi:mevalonate pyrophosphate decarboxylase
MKTQQEIEKEIIKIFDTTKYIDETEIAIADFLHKIRQDDIKRLIEWAENNKASVSNIVYLTNPPQYPWNNNQEIVNGYNKALDDILSHLKSQLKELN